MANPWDNDPIVGAPSGAMPGRPIIQQGPPLPSPQTPAQIEGQDLANRDRRYETQSKPTYDRANAVDKVRDGYRQDKRVLKYEDSIPIYTSALNAPDTPEADTLLVNAIAKIGDPSTGVQQREGDSYEQASPTAEQIRAKLQKQFGADHNGNFTPEARKRIKEAMRARMAAIADQYRLARKDHIDYIKSLGLPNVDPEQVVGPFAGLPFQGAEQAYLGHKPMLNYKQGPNGTLIDATTGATLDPNTGQPVERPSADQIQFGAAPDEQKKPFTPEQAAAYNAFLSANPNATPQQIAAFGSQIGVDITNAAQIADDLRHGKMPGGGENAQYAPDPSVEAAIDQRMEQGGGVGSAAVAGFGDTASFGLMDEAGAGLSALGQSLTGKGSFTDNYNREKAINSGYLEQLQDDHPIAFGAGQFGGAMAMPLGAGARTAGQLAKVGAAQGAAYGFGSGEGAYGRFTNALIGGGAGAATGAAFGYAAPAVTRATASAARKIVGPTSARQNALLQAGAEEGVPVNVSDVFPGSRNTVATLETIPGSAGPVQRGIEAGRDAIESRVQRLARGGTARENMGDAVVGAGERFVDKSGQQAERLYNAARSRAGNTPIQPNQVKRVVADLVKSEAEVPGGTRAGAVIRQYADAFDSGKPITIEGARKMRSELASRLRDDGGLSKQQATRITGKIMEGLNLDIEASLTAAGRGEAVKAYKMADKFYAQRMDEIERVVQKVIGTDAKPKSGLEAMGVLRSMSGQKGDPVGLTRMLKHLTPEERKDFAATLVEPLGRKSADEPFSPATFMQNVRQLSPSARRIIFGADGERSIQNLVRLSNAKKEGVNRLNNSRSGQVSNYRTVISTLLLGLPGGGAMLGASQAMNGATGAIGGAAIGGAGLAMSRTLAKALMNEEFTRLLANAPATTSPAAMNRHIGLLRKAASRDPAVRSVVENLEQQLVKFANDNGAMRAAASPSDAKEDEQNKRR